jgi:hypothetical protein
MAHQCAADANKSSTQPGHDPTSRCGWKLASVRVLKRGHRDDLMVRTGTAWVHVGADGDAGIAHLVSGLLGHAD